MNIIDNENEDPVYQEESFDSHHNSNKKSIINDEL